MERMKKLIIDSETIQKDIQIYLASGGHIEEIPKLSAKEIIKQLKEGSKNGKRYHQEISSEVGDRIPESDEGCRNYWPYFS